MATISCETCPNYLTAAQSAAHFGKSIGAPVCAKYKKVFGRMGATPKQVQKLQEHYAKFCDSYGQPRSPKLLINTFPVAIGNPDPGAPSLGKPSSCAGCSFFIPEDVVADELNWSAPLCRGKGNLLLGAELQKVAANCDIGKVGGISRTTSNVILFPEFSESFGILESSAVGAYLTADKAGYESDKPVTEIEAAQGIVGWRMIESADDTFEPIPGDEVYLPIFDDSIFDELDKMKIPQSGAKEHPEEYADHFGGVYACAVHLTKLDQAPMVWGEPGMGKTELFRHMAWMMGLPFERFSITASTELDELAGKAHFSAEKGTYFVYGRFVAAYRKPGMLCVDEPNLGQKDVAQFFRPLTDNSKQLALDANFGEIILPTPYTYLGFAGNPAWDLRNIGAELMADADTNRLMHIEVSLPDPPVELAIIQKHLAHDGWQLDEPQSLFIMKIAEEIRGLIKDGSLASMSWGLRPQIKVARALRYFGPIQAYRQAVANNLDPTMREILLEAVRGNVR